MQMDCIVYILASRKLLAILFSWFRFECLILALSSCLHWNIGGLNLALKLEVPFPHHAMMDQSHFAYFFQNHRTFFGLILWVRKCVCLKSLVQLFSLNLVFLE